MILPDFARIQLISINVRGFKANFDYINYLFTYSSLPVILCISEHWLYSFDFYLFNTISGSPGVAAESLVDDVYLPRLLRGRSGVAIFWSPSLDPLISVVSHPRSDRIIGIKLKFFSHDVIIFSVYLPCRSGCTDYFKELLDILDSTFTLYPGTIILFAGDFNADPGTVGGPRGNIPNEQGILLARYLHLWDFVSVHRHHDSSSSVFTHFSEAHDSFSVIDHILCPRFFLSNFLSAFVKQDDPLNTSDHYPIVTEFIVRLQFSPGYCFPSPSSHGQSYTPNWSKCSPSILEMYARTVSSNLPPLPSSWSIESINTIIAQITSVLLTAARSLIPSKSYHKFKRPGWDSKLKEAQSQAKSAYLVWKQVGSPTDPSSPVRIKYKNAKRIFRRELRRYKRNEVLQLP